MAGKGGGAWKVAYADFVTAMMAFFLVMWICSQDQKLRKAVAYYFIDPFGASKKPARSGGIVDESAPGNVPKEDGAAMARGRTSYTHSEDEVSRATQRLAEWLHRDKAMHEKWKDKAKQHLDAAPAAQPVRDRKVTISEYAEATLSRELRDEMHKGVPENATGLYQDMVYGSLGAVNWTQLAQDLLAQ